MSPGRRRVEFVPWEATIGFLFSVARLGVESAAKVYPSRTAFARLTLSNDN